tara:strand:- start:3251 stop:3478 length:228 start_codon:yes stop_codon:yes gene_type:complete
LKNDSSSWLWCGYSAYSFFVLIALLIIEMRIYLFRILAKVNKRIFPSLYNKDIVRLKGYEKAILAYRFWVTRNSL